jgi:hypothetical protein
MRTSLKHPEFVSTAEQHRRRYKERLSQPYPQVHKIVLRSVDRDAGSTKMRATFSGVSIPASLGMPAALYLDSFVLPLPNTGNPPDIAMEVRIAGVSHPRSYDTSNKSPSDLLALVSGYTFQNQGQSFDSVGIPITDPNQFNNRPLTIYFQSIDGTALATFAGEWALVLNIVSYDENTPY